MSGRPALNATHDPAARSWVTSANTGGEFPLQNLPFAVFRRRGDGEAWRGGVAIGDQILDLVPLTRCVPFDGEAALALRAASLPTLNALMSLGASSWSALRAALFSSLLEGSALQSTLIDCLVPQVDAEYALPAAIGDYTDFYTSIHHASAVGRLFRPDNPLTPNYRWMPIGYHGRASSVMISTTPFQRPVGQRLPAGADTPEFAPSARLDFELEVGIFIGPGNAGGVPIPVAAAERHVFGLCLLNDWSARDIQAWEYQPLGPFLGKNFATTISPWVVTLEALAPFRAPYARPDADPPPLAYLDDALMRTAGAFDLQLEVLLDTATMRERALPPMRLCRTNFRHAYWTVAQMLAHHTAGGCTLRPGDLFGSGTQSGPGPGEAGSLLEVTAGGSRALTLPSAETRTFLADGDRVIMRGWCERAGFARLGFGSCVAQVLPARAPAEAPRC
ncbi:MAG TPA: fumarylacetoacetase [Steroidobacteraceae bacterium]|nr:fumarylacetoacetase [Steroidobacteraceae bacterium]